MSFHKARPGQKRPDPTQPASTVMHNGRIAAPHAEIEGKPVLGGLQNAVVEGVTRTPEEEKAKIEEYHERREAVKKAQSEQFNQKTGEPKPTVVKLESDPKGDADAAPAAGPTAPPEEIKKNAEAEKKLNNEIEKKPDAKPVGPQTPKTEGKK